MTGMTPERLDAIRANLPTPDADLSRRERDAHDLLAEVKRLTSENARLRTGITGQIEAARREWVDEGDTDALSRAEHWRTLLNPTEGEDR